MFDLIKIATLGLNEVFAFTELLGYWNFLPVNNKKVEDIKSYTNCQKK